MGDGRTLETKKSPFQQKLLPRKTGPAKKDVFILGYRIKRKTAFDFERGLAFFPPNTHVVFSDGIIAQNF